MNKKLIFVFSPKSQTGKTTISNYLALLLAKKEYLTSVIELNRYSGYSPYLNNKLAEKKSLKNAIDNKDEIRNNFIQSAHNPNLFTMAMNAENEMLDLHTFPKDALKNIINFATKEFEITIVDLPTGYLEIGLMEIIDLQHDWMITVIDNNLETFWCLKQYDLMFNKMNYDVKNNLTVINKDVGLIEHNVFTQFNEELVKLKAEKVTYIPFIPEIIKNANEGNMLADIIPTNKKEKQMSKALNLIIKEIEKIEILNVAKDSEKEKSKKKFLEVFKFGKKKGDQ